ncbi:hypothetical protein M5K25_008688 [Dendrobium thyrsiflorum]|uniref:Uncharacterized protein n=1 Tax=Dendrobium thyrsiflorum TaxID=117978 RepID=A0ABD0V971_DENTH
MSKDAEQSAAKVRKAAARTQAAPDFARRRLFLSLLVARVRIIAADFLHRTWSLRVGTASVFGIRVKMAESSRRVAPGEERSLEALWAEHSGLVKHTEELAADFRRFAEEVHRDLRAIHAQLNRRLNPQEAVPATTPVARRGFDGRRNYHPTIPVVATSDSEDLEEPMGAFNLSQFGVSNMAEDRRSVGDGKRIPVRLFPPQFTAAESIESRKRRLAHSLLRFRVHKRLEDQRNNPHPHKPRCHPFFGRGGEMKSNQLRGLFASRRRNRISNQLQQCFEEAIDSRRCPREVAVEGNYLFQYQNSTELPGLIP